MMPPAFVSGLHPSMTVARQWRASAGGARRLASHQGEACPGRSHFFAAKRRAKFHHLSNVPAPRPASVIGGVLAGSSLGNAIRTRLPVG